MLIKPLAFVLAAAAFGPAHAGLVSFERREGMEVAVQLPAGVRPRAVAFVAHGCSHSGTDFFEASVDCPQCLGLPVERGWTEALLARGFAVVAGSSPERKYNKCWGGSRDVPVAKRALDGVVADTPLLAGLPLFGVGASSGGAFIAELGMAAGMVAVCVQIAGVAVPHTRKASFPAVVFTHMPRDTRTAKHVGQAVTDLERRRPDDVKEILSYPRAVTSDFFSEAIQGVSAELSAAVAEALLGGGFLDERGEYLDVDPRRSAWRDAVRPVLAARGHDADTLVADESAIAEMMNVAYAMHEFTDAGMEATLDFFEERL